MQRRRARILGPYEERGGRWRVIVLAENGKRTGRFFETKRSAEKWIRNTAEELGLQQETRTLKDAVDAYELRQREKGNKPSSVADTVRRLKRFFGPELDRELADLEPEVCEERYSVLRQELAVDSHRNILAETKTFLRWCVDKRWTADSPAEAIEGQGKRQHGKEKLRIDEARAWSLVALRLAHEDEPGAVAALVSLLMGMRSSEIVRRQVRDVDDEGRLLWIDRSKTKAGKRKLEVPSVLRPFLLELAEGKEGSAPLFPSRRREWVRAWVRRICELAAVPMVCAHAMRGLQTDLALEAGATAELAAKALGHEHVSTTEQSYASARSLAASKSRRALRVLLGGVN